MLIDNNRDGIPVELNITEVLIILVQSLWNVCINELMGVDQTEGRDMGFWDNLRRTRVGKTAECMICKLFDKYYAMQDFFTKQNTDLNSVNIRGILHGIDQEGNVIENPGIPCFPIRRSDKRSVPTICVKLDFKANKGKCFHRGMVMGFMMPQEMIDLLKTGTVDDKLLHKSKDGGDRIYVAESLLDLDFAKIWNLISPKPPISKYVDLTK